MTTAGEGCSTVKGSGGQGEQPAAGICKVAGQLSAHLRASKAASGPYLLTCLCCCALLAPSSTNTSTFMT